MSVYQTNFVRGSYISVVHRALLRAVFWSTLDNRIDDVSIDYLRSQGAVVNECIKIWNDLSPAEQSLVRSAATHRPLINPDALVLADLQLKGILHGDPPALFSPLFGTFVETQGSGGVVIDRSQRRVWVDGEQL